MSGLGRLTVSAEVAAAVGAEELALLEARVTAEGYDCAGCGRRSALADEPAVVFVRDAGPGVGWARVAHARCAASEAAGTAELPEEMTVTVVAGVAPHASGPRALVLAEMPATVSTRSAGGERIDEMAAWLADRGLQPVLRAGQRPAPAPGWSLLLPSPGTAVITGPGEVLYEGTMITPPGWLDVAAARGAELLVGVTGLARTSPSEPAVGLLAAAARSGSLVGGTIALRPPALAGPGTIPRRRRDERRAPGTGPAGPARRHGWG